MFKKWTALLLALAMAGCSSAPTSNTTDSGHAAQKGEDQVEQTNQSSEDTAFDEYLDEYFKEYCSRSYLLAHRYFTDYQKEGITLKEDAYSLGNFVPTQEDRDFTNAVLEKLKGFDREKLTGTYQAIYDQMTWSYEFSKESDQEKYLYLGSIWSENFGTQSEVYTYFAEFELYNENDVDALVKVIDNVPQYFEEAIAFSKEQAKRDLLAFNLDSVLTYCQDTLDNQASSPVFEELDLEVDTLMLDEAKANEYKQQIHDALNRSFFPSYQYLIDELSSMKDEIGEVVGLAQYENGREYYEKVLQSATGTDSSLDEINQEVSSALMQLSTQGQQLIESGFDMNSIMSIDTGLKSPEEILGYLEENYAKSFPVVNEMEYEIKALPDEQSQSGVTAYFVNPPIDSTRPYQMRYNARDFGQDFSSLSFFDTMAHEGIPGHMYQAQFNKEHFVSNAQYSMSDMAMQEGYATYAGEVAQSWLGLDEQVLEGYKLNTWLNNYSILQADLLINGAGVSKDEFVQIYGEQVADIYDRLAQEPGVFFSYYFGYYLITQKRAEAQEELKDKFNEVEFNQALLKDGNLRFSIVEENIDEYIEKAKTS
mgnify:CR=1 FL=1